MCFRRIVLPAAVKSAVFAFVRGRHVHDRHQSTPIARIGKSDDEGVVKRGLLSQSALTNRLADAVQISLLIPGVRVSAIFEFLHQCAALHRINGRIVRVG